MSNNTEAETQGNGDEDLNAPEEEQCSTIQVEEYEDNEPFDDSEVVYDVSTYGADFDVEGLIRRMDKESIFRPGFQRQFVWTQVQASKFIESILLGLPIPSIFLYKQEDTQRFIIVDGLQRLTTLQSFKKGFLPRRERKFKLVNVKDAFKGKSYEDLSPEEEARFDNAIVHAMIIQQHNPKNDHSAILHIFDRLNSTGTPLTPQEIRIAVYQGEFIELLRLLNGFDDWRNIFSEKPHLRAKDEELILRFLAFFYKVNEYKKPSRKFLDNFIEVNSSDIDKNKLEEYETLFTNTISRIFQALGSEAFRAGGPLNVAIFDSFMCAVANNQDVELEGIKDAYEKLMDDNEYMLACTKSTSDTKVVETRFQKAMESFGDQVN